jgi:hypothetical protein
MEKKINFLSSQKNEKKLKFFFLKKVSIKTPKHNTKMNTNTKTTVKNTKADTKVATKAVPVPVPVPEPVFEVKDDLIEDDYGEEEEEEEEEDEAVIAELEKHFTPEQREASKAERAKRVKKPALSAKHRNLMAVCHWFVSRLPEEMRTDELLAQLLIKDDLETQTAFYSQFNAKEEVKIVKNIGKPVKVPRVPKAKKPVVVAVEPAVELVAPAEPVVEVVAPAVEEKKTKKVVVKRVVDPETAEKVKVAVGKK